MKNPNRYARIHMLFRILAKARGAKNDQQGMLTVKKWWKDFFGINSLTELSDKSLDELEEFIEKRIAYEEKSHAKQPSNQKSKAN